MKLNKKIMTDMSINASAKRVREVINIASENKVDGGGVVAMLGLIIMKQTSRIIGEELNLPDGEETVDVTLEQFRAASNKALVKSKENEDPFRSFIELAETMTAIEGLKAEIFGEEVKDEAAETEA